MGSLPLPLYSILRTLTRLNTTCTLTLDTYTIIVDMLILTYTIIVDMLILTWNALAHTHTHTHTRVYFTLHTYTSHSTYFTHILTHTQTRRALHMHTLCTHVSHLYHPHLDVFFFFGSTRAPWA